MARCASWPGASRSDVAWCHCQSCRKHSGAPVSVFVAFRRDAFAVTKGEITKFNSSPGRWRGFCAAVGPRLTCEGEPQLARGAFSYRLDRPGRAVCADQAYFPGRTPAVAALERGPRSDRTVRRLVAWIATNAAPTVMARPRDRSNGAIRRASGAQGGKKIAPRIAWMVRPTLLIVAVSSFAERNWAARHKVAPNQPRMRRRAAQ